MSDSVEYNTIVSYRQKLDGDLQLQDEDTKGAMDAVRRLQNLKEVDRAPYETTLSGLRMSIEMRINRDAARGRLTAEVHKQLQELQAYLPKTLREMSADAVKEYDQQQLDAANLRQAEADSDRSGRG